MQAVWQIHYAACVREDVCRGADYITAQLIAAGSLLHLPGFLRPAKCQITVSQPPTGIRGSSRGARPVSTPVDRSDGAGMRLFTAHLTQESANSREESFHARPCNCQLMRP
jgi:hypothetical protein